MTSHVRAFRRIALAAVTALVAVTCTDRPGPLASFDDPIASGPAFVDPAPGTDVVFVGAGDIASCSTNRDEATAQLLDAIPGTVFTLGDNAYSSGTAAEYTTCYEPTWGRHKARTMPAAGDRDYGGGNAGAPGYYGYFGAAAGDPAKGYYSYDLGGWHIVVLNSQLSFKTNSVQYAWLVADLAASNTRCTLAYWHKPLFFSSGGSRGGIKPAWDALYAAGAEIVINSHSRFYERFAPQTPGGGADAFGIREFVVGTGGAGTSTFGSITANSEARNSGTAGVLKLTLSDGAYSWEFVPVAGQTFTDAGSGLCYTGAPPTAAPGGPYGADMSAPTVAVDGTASSDPQNDLPLTYAWDFGDGASGTGATPSHTYAGPGVYTVSLTVTDAKGNPSAPATTTATISDVGAPIASAGGPYTADVTVAFDGSASSDPDGDLPLTYAWDFGDGSSGTGATPSHTYVADGVHTVTLVVTDAGATASAPATTTATITNAAPPIAQTGGPYVEATTVAFNGSASSDPQGDLPLTYAWSFGDGSTGAGATPSHSYAGDGVYTVTLVVTDTKGSASAPATTTATINGADTPVARPGGPYTADLTVVFDGSTSSDPDGELPLTYAWNFGDGASGTGATPNHTYAADGVYTVTLVVTDAGGTASAPATTSATLTNAAPPIAQTGGPYAAEATVAFNGSASSDPQGDLPLAYAWSFGDGASGTGATPSHTYAADGVYTVTLTVTDAKGRASDPATTTATIQNAVPVVSAGADQSVTLGTPVTVSATFSDAAGDAPWGWQIAWGDGATDGGVTSDPSAPITGVHTYAAAGAYTVGVTVTDRDGGAGTDQLTVTVAAPGGTFVLVGAGDISSCGNNRDELTAQLLDTIPGTVVTLGDNAYPDGRTVDYANCYNPTWGRHKARTKASLGNHEYGAGNADGSFDYFGDNVGPRGLGYYSFDLGDWHVVVLNDNADFVPFSAGTAQDQWLVADLAANTRQCVLAIWHQPRFFSSNTAGFTSRLSRKIYWDRLYAAGADVVLNGHQHQYERFAPMNPDGVRDDANGIREFVVGTGGESTATPTLEIAANSEVRIGTFGVIKMTLGAGTYTWQFIPMAGQTFTDSGSGTCH